MTYDNTNRGILSKNTRKEKESHPEYNGTINVEGVEYWLSAWVKERNDGTGKFFSLSVKPKEERQPAQSSRATANVDDDIPF